MTTSREPVPVPVLVTGAFGLVGSALVKQLVHDDRRVVATDLDVPANRTAAAKLPRDVDVRWADLTKPADVDAVVTAVSPAVIVHLAAIIPPQCYARRALARAVNVDATASLVRAAESLPSLPRFVQVSSVAVCGAHNPHHVHDLLSTDTPVAPVDLYGSTEAEAEQIVRSSSLEWVVVRLGGVLSPDMAMSGLNLDTVYFEASLPADNRTRTVDVRDVARAISAAITTDAVREVFLLSGDESHRVRLGDVAPQLATAIGLVGGIPPGLVSSGLGADTIDSHLPAMTVRAPERDVRGRFSGGVDCHAPGA